MACYYFNEISAGLLCMTIIIIISAQKFGKKMAIFLNVPNPEYPPGWILTVFY